MKGYYFNFVLAVLFVLLAVVTYLSREFIVATLELLIAVVIALAGWAEAHQ